MKDFIPVECSDKLYNIGLLVKSRRLQLGVRQADINSTLGVSPQTLRKIENGSPVVELRSFMLVLWRLGLIDEVFRSLNAIEESSQLKTHNPHQPRRVRLSKAKAEDF